MFNGDISVRIGTLTRKKLSYPKMLLAAALLMGLLAGLSWGELSKGHQWQRIRPLTVSAMVEMYGAGSLLDRWEPLNFSCLMRHGWGMDPNNTIRVHSEAGNDWMVFAPTADQAWFDQHVQSWRASYPGNIGWQVGDEAMSNLAALGALLDHVRGLVDDDTLIYSNAAPYDMPGIGSFSQWVSYLEDYCTQVAPDVLLVTHYPFYSNSISDDYYAGLKAVRDAGLVHNLPYWQWNQAFGFIPSYGPHYEPSESDMRLQFFTALAYGYSGILFWSYDSNYSPYTQCILNYANQPTHMYHSIKGITDEIRVWGNLTAYLTSTSVGWITGGSGAPAGLSNWTPGDGGDEHIVSISVDTVGSNKNGLLGVFADDDGDRYFMLVNTDHAYNKTAAECATQFTITFDESVNSILSLDRQSQQLTRIHLTDNQYTFTLPGGTGDVFKYDDGKAFPGQRIVDYDEYSPADFNGDGLVNIIDLMMLSSGWLESAH